MPNKKIKGARYILDDGILNASTSGGVFYALASYIIKNEGIVYGAAFDDNNIVRHIGIDRLESIKRLQGSKYVQSTIDNTYNDVKENLEKGKMVLFSGTPCQVAGLRCFLKIDYSNLFTMDFTCHGVPSPLFFEKYLEWIENKIGEKINPDEFTFRTKKYGWYYRRHMSYMMKIKNRYKYVGADPYYANFLKGNNYRESCYSCCFKLDNLKSDLSVGDFNGIDINYPQHFDKRGVSYIVINNSHGDDLFKKVQDSLYVFDADYDTVLESNKTLTTSVTRPKHRDIFYQDIREEFFIRHKNSEISWKNRIKPFVPYFIEKAIVSRKIHD